MAIQPYLWLVVLPKLRWKSSNYRNKQVSCRAANKNIEDAGLSDKIEDNNW